MQAYVEKINALAASQLAAKASVISLHSPQFNVIDVLCIEAAPGALDTCFTFEKWQDANQEYAPDSAHAMHAAWADYMSQLNASVSVSAPPGITIIVADLAAFLANEKASLTRIEQYLISLSSLISLSPPHSLNSPTSLISLSTQQNRSSQQQEAPSKAETRTEANPETLTQTHYHRIPGDRLKQAKERVLPLVIESQTPLLAAVNTKASHPFALHLWPSVVASALHIVVSRYSHSQAVALLTLQSNNDNHDNGDNHLRGKHTALKLAATLSNALTFNQLVQQNQVSAFLTNQLRYLTLVGSGKDKNPCSYFNHAHSAVGLSVNTAQPSGPETPHLNESGIAISSLNLDIALSLTPSQNDFTLTWTFNSNKYSPLFIQDFEAALITCLQSAIHHPNAAVNTLAIVDSIKGNGSSKKRASSSSQTESSLEVDVLTGSSNEKAVFATSFNIVQLFEKQVATSGHAVAIKAASTLSYVQLNQKVNQVAHLLQADGVKAGARVGVLLDYSEEILISMLAIWKLNAQYVPFDPAYPTERLHYMLSDATVDWMLTKRGFVGLLATQTNPKAKLTILQWDTPEFQQRLAAQPSANLSILLENPLAYVVYTSGTTGTPKGVMGTHESLSNRLTWLQSHYPAGEGTRFGASTSICFVDHIAELLQPVMCGGTVCMLPVSCEEDTLQAHIELIQHQRVERLTLLPSVLFNLLQKAPTEALSNLKLVITSGEPLYQNVVDAFHTRLNGEATLLNLYGTTECGADVSFYEAPYPEHLRVMQYFDAVKPQQSGLPTQISVDEDYFTAPNVPAQSLIQQFMSVDIPASPKAYERYIEQIKTELFPYLVDVSSQKFIGHMTSALPSFMSEFSRFITQANQNIVKIETSKVLTFMERQLMAMLHNMFFEQDAAYYQARVQDPKHMFGVVTSGGSLANVMALYSARNKALMQQGVSKEQLQKQGAIACMHALGYSRAVVLVSRLAHYSIRKTVGLLGLGEDNLIIIEQDEHQRINTQKLAHTIEACRQDNRFIIAMIGIAGATETGTVDPLPQLAQIAQENRIHFHVDAAWGGAFIFSDEYKYKLAGIEHADTITFCAHKQLYLAQGISLCLFKDSQGLYSVTTHAEYQAEAGSFDLGQFTLEGSRPASSLMLHAALHLFSRSGYDWLMQQSMRKAAFLKAMIQNSDCFELVGENDLNIINYRYIPRALRSAAGQFTSTEHEQISRATESIQELQFLQGRTFVSKTRIIHPQFSEAKISVFRVVPINPRTTFDDLTDVLNDQLALASTHIENTQNTQQITVTQNMMQALAPIRTSVPIGRPISNTQLLIMDSHQNLLPPGAIGEIYVAGKGVAQGYLNQPTLTQHSFVSLKGYPRLYRTFDLGRIRHDGQIEYCGRLDHQVKLHGSRIELDEIEVALRAIDDIAVAKVALLPIRSRGEFLEQNGAIVAYIEPSSTLSQRDKNRLKGRVQTELRKHLPEDHIPEKWVIFNKVPTLPNGKIDLNQCQQFARENLV